MRRVVRSVEQGGEDGADLAPHVLDHGQQAGGAGLLAEFEPGARPSLLGLASLRAGLSKLLGVTTDLVEREALRPAVRAAAEREAVRVL